jgi:hypothetical protein
LPFEVGLQGVFYMTKNNKSNNNNKSFKIGRDATNGQFIPVEKAKKDPKHSVVETIKRPQ